MTTLAKLSILVAQPSLTELDFQDNTPTGTGGWNTGSGGDYLLSAALGYVLKLKRHFDADYVTITKSLNSELVTMRTKFVTDMSTFSWGTNTDKFPDAIYTVSYAPKDSSGVVINTIVSNVLVIAQTRLAEAKLLVRSMGFSNPTVKKEMAELFNDLRISIAKCKALVLVDDYTNAVKVFNEMQAILNELNTIR